MYFCDIVLPKPLLNFSLLCVFLWHFYWILAKQQIFWKIHQYFLYAKKYLDLVRLCMADEYSILNSLHFVNIHFVSLYQTGRQGMLGGSTGPLGSIRCPAQGAQLASSCLQQNTFFRCNGLP